MSLWTIRRHGSSIFCTCSNDYEQKGVFACETNWQMIFNLRHYIHITAAEVTFYYTRPCNLCLDFVNKNLLNTIKKVFLRREEEKKSAFKVTKITTYHHINHCFDNHLVSFEQKNKYLPNRLGSRYDLCIMCCWTISGYFELWPKESELKENFFLLNIICMIIIHMAIPSILNNPTYVKARRHSMILLLWSFLSLF